MSVDRLRLLFLAPAPCFASLAINRSRAVKIREGKVQFQLPASCCLVEQKRRNRRSCCSFPSSLTEGKRREAQALASFPCYQREEGKEALAYASSSFPACFLSPAALPRGRRKKQGRKAGNRREKSAASLRDQRFAARQRKGEVRIR
uniref:hypothetical protein 50 n=1 Tax=Moniliophthora perniciosa TaxID=153609 RepID=UPI000024235F|nr:hypothetical protein 50 [Moniliophthora perniciosa]AAQ74340.1 hypothetical protein 50 [Moniliophthora perniciosa]